MKYDLNTCDSPAYLIDPFSFSPFPKNPVVARFFKEIGWADELGSGARNLFRFSKEYSGQAPELIEGDIFNIVVATPADAAGQVPDKPSSPKQKYVAAQKIENKHG